MLPVSFELTAMRAVVASTFTSSAAIGRKSATKSGAGTDRITYTTVATLPCRLYSQQVRQAGNVQEGDKPVIVTAWRAKFAYGADVRQGDRLTIGAQPYIVLDANAGRTDALSLVVNLNRVD
jgi:hypothetical protein